MKLNQLILFFLLLSVLFSCSKEFTPISQISQDELVIIAELEVGVDVSLQISSTFGNDTKAIVPDGDDGEVRMTNESNQQFNKELRWVENQQRWIQTSFRFFAGQEIKINTDFSDIGLGKAEATVLVPAKGEIINKEDAIKVTSNDRQAFQLSLELSEISEDDYYHIMPYIEVDNQNKFLDISSVLKNNAATFELTHMDGILIDYQLLEDDKNLLFEVTSKDLSNPDPSIIHLILKTVPKAYYDFHKSLTLQKETQQGPFDAPVPTYTNIEGAQGIFVAYQSLVDSVPVR